MFAFALVQESTNAATGGTTPLITLPAALAAVVIGAALTSFGALINDYFASRREDRRDKREAARQEAREEREDRLNRELQQREDKLRREEGRVVAYQKFLDAATLQSPLIDLARQERHTELNKSYMETQLYAGPMASQWAQDLYESAAEAIATDDEGADIWGRLHADRKAFLESVRQDKERGE